MVYKKIANETGNYVDENKVRFTVLEAHEAHTPQGKNVGWDEYENRAAASAAYGVVYDPLPDEELSTNEG